MLISLLLYVGSGDFFTHWEAPAQPLAVAGCFTATVSLKSSEYNKNGISGSWRTCAFLQVTLRGVCSIWELVQRYYGLISRCWQQASRCGWIYGTVAVGVIKSTDSNQLAVPSCGRYCVVSLVLTMAGGWMMGSAGHSSAFCEDSEYCPKVQSFVFNNLPLHSYINSSEHGWIK